MKSLLAKLTKIWWIKFAMDVAQRFGKDNGGILAAGLAFFMLLAFIPILLVGIAALGYYFNFVHSTSVALVQVQNLLTTQVMPGGAGNEVKTLMEQANIGKTIQNVTEKRGISGIIGVGGLIWSASQIYVNASVAMNAAWETTEKRGWVKLHLITIGLLIGTGVLLVLSLAATALGTTLAHKIHLPGTAMLITIGTEVAAVLVSAAMYTVTYKVLPSAQVTWRAAACGGILAAIAWEIAKKGLAVYLTHPNVSLYGNVANLFVFIGWVYYSMMILLFGAEASVVYCLTFEGHRAQGLRRAAHGRAALDAVAAAAPSPLQRAKDKGRNSRSGKAPQHTPHQ